jgi:hypothetical protein
MRLLDALSFVAQLSGCLHWIFIRHSLGNSQMIDWALPVSLILISFGWWENHVNGDAPISQSQSTYIKLHYCSMTKCYFLPARFYQIFRPNQRRNERDQTIRLRNY